MAKKVTRRVPGQRVGFDPWRTIKKIHWDTRGEWCVVGVYLGNLGEGGNGELSMILKPGLEPFVIPLGTNGDGNGAFWNVREQGLPVSQAHFDQKVTLSDGTKMQAYGLREFDAGDNHNGAEFYFKAPGRDFVANANLSALTASPPFARLYDTKTFTRFTQTVISEAAGPDFGVSESFQFNIAPTHDPKTVTLI